MSPRYVIVGSGLAGVMAAQALIKGDPSAQVRVFGAEPYLYYRRPMLWQYISGEIDEAALYFRPATWYAGQGIQLDLNARVTAIEAKAHRIICADGRAVEYDRLLLAMGGRPFVPPIVGADRPGVFCLRTLDDARAIKARAAQCRSVIVIGGGLLGLETARSLLSAQTQVSILEFMPHLLPRQLGAAGASVLQDRFAKMGFRVLTAAVTDEIFGDDAVQGVRLKDGRVVQGEMVVISAGIRSRVELARSAGLEVNRGVVVDAHLRTSDPDIYAAGDVAEFDGKVYGIVPAATEQARAAAANMLAPDSIVYHGTVPSTTLKVAGIGLTCLGNSNALGEGGFTILIWADREAGVFKKLVLKDARITGAILLGDTGGDARIVKKLIQDNVDLSQYQNQLLSAELDLQALAQINS